jgi:ClpP class serine protease
MNRLISTISSEPWCIRPEILEGIIEIAERQNDVQAVEAKLGVPLDNTRTVSRRGDVAIIPITGSIFRYANLMTRVSGATSVSILAEDFTKASEDDEIKTIVLRIDSGGGQASGIAELADMIRKSPKRVITYVDSQCASAGYWLGCSANEIVANKTAMLGYIGVVYALEDKSEANKKSGINNIEIVSNISPKKRPDISSQEGQAQIQIWADKLGDLFINAVADFRGVTEEKVLSDFGQGDMLIASDALNVGMIDRIGDFESLIEEIQQNKDVSNTNFFIGENNMVTLEQFKTENPEAYEQVVAGATVDGATQERARIESIDTINSVGCEAIISGMKFDGKSTANDVKSALFDASAKAQEVLASNAEADASVVALAIGEISTAEVEEIVEPKSKSQESIDLMASTVAKLNGKKGDE